MIIINNVDDKYFEFNGTQYAKIYQPLKQGSESISILQVYDSKIKLNDSENYSEFLIDGATYGSQAETIAALLPLVLSIVALSDLENLEDRVENLEENQNTGWIQYLTYVDLAASALAENVLYIVTNDPDTTLINPPLSNNAYYSYDGADIIRAADLVVSEIDPLDTSRAVSGKAVADYTESELSVEDNSIIPSTVQSGYINSTDGSIGASSEWEHIIVDIPESAKNMLLSGSVRPTLTALAVFYDDLGGFVSSDYVGTGTQVVYVDQEVEIPSSATKVGVTALVVQDEPVAKYTYLLPKFVAVEEQEFTEAKKEQARKNIDALGEEEIYQDSRVEIESSVVGGYYRSDNGAFVSTTEWDSIIVDIPDNALNVVLSGSVRPSLTCLACFFDDGDNFVSSDILGTGTEEVYVDEVVEIPEGATKVGVTALAAEANPVAKYTYKGDTKYVSTNEQELSDEQKSTARKNIGILNPFEGKKITIYGTSIPAGQDNNNYPLLIGKKLGATMSNEAIPSSMIRRSTRTGDYVGTAWANIKNCMSKTLEEVQDLIDNWDTYRLTLSPPETTTPMSAADQLYCERSSFETILTPYLDGTKDMPDLFILDHGHNDWKYTRSNGSSDIDLEPTVANIQSGELAEDTFMTDNNNAKLESFFGSLDKIDPADKDDFIASVNRNCYIGATNFIMTYILTINPRARFVFISNYEDWSQYSPLIGAQETIASEWLMPLCEVYKRLGYSNKIIPNTYDYWGDARTYDLNMYDIYLKDKVHPHSDTTGQANEIYAAIIAEFLTGCS